MQKWGFCVCVKKEGDTVVRHGHVSWYQPVKWKKVTRRRRSVNCNGAILDKKYNNLSFWLLAWSRPDHLTDLTSCGCGARLPNKPPQNPFSAAARLSCLSYRLNCCDYIVVPQQPCKITEHWASRCKIASNSLREERQRQTESTKLYVVVRAQIIIHHHNSSSKLRWTQSETLA